MKKIYQNIEFSLLSLFFFLTILATNYKSLTLLYHGNREIHLYVIGFSILHAIISIILIKFFFINKDYFFLKKIQKFISKNIRDFLIVTILIVLSFFVAFKYISLVEENNLTYFFYEPTSKFPDSLIKVKKEFTAIIFSISIVFSYFIFRLFGICRPISLLLCVIFITSPLHLYHLIPAPFRDYFSKSIIIYLLFFSFLILLRKIDCEDLKISILFTTIILSFGLYVRQDLIIFFFILIPLITYVLYQKKMKKKQTFFLIFSIFFILSPQALRFLGTSGNVVQGLITSTEVNFLLNRPLYDLGYSSNDNFLWLLTIIDTNLFLKSILNFPADFVTKIISSSQQIFNLISQDPTVMPGISNDFILNFYKYRFFLVNTLNKDVINLFFLILVISLFYKKISHGIIICLIFFVLLSYPILNFYGRHYFYLEIIPLLSLGVTLQLIGTTLINFKNTNIRTLVMKTYKSTIMVTLIILIGFTSVQILKIYQKYNYDKILDKLIVSEKEELKFVKLKEKDRTLFKIDTNHLFKNNNYVNSIYGIYGSVEHVLIDIDFKKCGLETIWPILRYNNKNGVLDYSRPLRISKNDNSNLKNFAMFSVYQSLMKKDINQGFDDQNIFDETKFVGIELSNFESQCFNKILKIKDFPTNLPKSLSILGYNYKPYFKFYSKENNNYEIPINVSQKLNEKSLSYIYEKLNRNNLDFIDENLSIISLPTELISNSGNKNDNYCSPRPFKNKNKRLKFTIKKDSILNHDICVNDSDLLWTKSIKKNKGDIFFVEGKVINGGLKIGFIEKDKSSAYIEINSYGNFKAFLQIPKDGYYNFGISNYVNLNSNKKNHIFFNKVGWFSLN